MNIFETLFGKHGMLLAMDKPLPELLDRWLAAGLVDRAQAERILAFEGRDPGPIRRRLFSGLAIALGAGMVGAGILLFVAANWAHLAPGVRFLVVLALTGGFHLLGAWAAPRSPGLAMALHGTGSLALGAGIYLSGQIFNLQEHWPDGLLLWSLGAWLGCALLRDWVQGSLAAVLTPLWLLGEGAERAMDGQHAPGTFRVMALGCLLLSISYLTLARPGRDGPLRRALAWIGGLALIPGAVAVIMLFSYSWGFQGPEGLLGILGDPVHRVEWVLALGLPLALAALARGRAVWMNAVATLWALALAKAAIGSQRAGMPGGWVYALCALGALGLILWGLAEARRERVNLGMAGFALTVLAFYFSSVMDKLGRSLGLMGLGLLFLAGGWQLERLRRRLNALIGRRTP